MSGSGDLQFVYGLLCGTYRVRSLPTAEDLRNSTFLDAALGYEEDERGRPLTLVGLQLCKPSDPTADIARGEHLLINPGPKHALKAALRLLALAERLARSVVVLAFLFASLWLCGTVRADDSRTLLGCLSPSDSRPCDTMRELTSPT